MPCWRMAARTGEGFLEERGLSEGAKVAEGCFRRVGIEDMDVDEACRTVTGLLSLLDTLRGASWASAMLDFDQGFLDVSQAVWGICMLCLRQSVCSVLATDAVKCGSESDSKSKEASQIQVRKLPGGA